jgi:cytochrome c-type biogenesis protein CcmH/NrfG
MKAESVVFAIGGMVFGLLGGWFIGDQHARRSGTIPVASSAAPASETAETRPPPPLDETQVKSLMNVANGDAKNVNARVQLANLYFDAERFPDAITWYEQALALDPRNVDVSTDLGVSYYYSNQADRALQQFDHSLGISPTHTKTLLNQGIGRAFGKQDLTGAAESWQKVVESAPGSPEAQAAQRALESLKQAHEGGAATAPGS